jgi:hypothetical protein
MIAVSAIMSAITTYNCTLSYEQNQLKLRGNVGALPPPFLVELRTAKPDLLAAFERAGSLVEKCGRLNVYLQQNAQFWSDTEWPPRRDALLRLLGEMDAALAATGGSIEQHGWQLSGDLQWHRIGEPAPDGRWFPADVLEQESASRCFEQLALGV